MIFWFFQNLSFWFLKWLFFISTITQMIFLISKIRPFDFWNDFLISKNFLFDFQNLSVWFLLISKIVSLISEMVDIHYSDKHFCVLWAIMRSRLFIDNRRQFKLYSLPQRPRSFWCARRIATSGQLNLLSMQRKFFSKSQPIRFVRLDSEHAQCNGKFLNFLCWTFPEVLTKKSVASGKENG